MLTWVGKQKHFEVNKPSETDLQFLYEHPDTGVRFLINYYPGDAEEEDGLVPRGFRDTGLSFNLNFVRPSFYPLEAFPIAREFAEAFGLLGYDPAGEEGGDGDPEDEPPRPHPLDVEKLTASWAEGNRFAVRALAPELHDEGIDMPPYMPPEKSMDWWRYMSRRASLQEELGHGVYVPSIFLMRSKGKAEVVTAVTWSEAVPMVFPATDLVLLYRRKKKLFGLRKVEELGYLDAGELMKGLDPFLDDASDPVPMRILTPEASVKEPSKIFWSASIDTDMGPLQHIPPGGFVDVKP